MGASVGGGLVGEAKSDDRFYPIAPSFMDKNKNGHLEEMFYRFFWGIQNIRFYYVAPMNHF